jgi:hypothetical protein
MQSARKKHIGRPWKRRSKAEQAYSLLFKNIVIE